MPDARAVYTRWRTDQGLRRADVWVEDADVTEALREAVKQVEQGGAVPLALVRCYTRTAPMVGDSPSWVLAGPMQRVNVHYFTIRQGMLV